MVMLDYCRNQIAKSDPINLNSATNNKSISKRMLFSHRILNQTPKKVTINRVPNPAPKQAQYYTDGLGSNIQSVPKSIFYYDNNNNILFSTDKRISQSLINRPQAFHIHK
tara:strand:+ start:12714 stop:13043 length:330 start_codon:yes stop_codon:yes gene_type:complete